MTCYSNTDTFVALASDVRQQVMTTLQENGVELAVPVDADGEVIELPVPQREAAPDVEDADETEDGQGPEPAKDSDE